jgi:hypothetical protein
MMSLPNRRHPTISRSRATAGEHAKNVISQPLCVVVSTREFLVERRLV